MTDKLQKHAEGFFLFEGLDEQTLEELLCSAHPEILDYKKGDTVYTPHEFKERLGFVIKGACRVLHCREHAEDLPLTTLKANDSFGVLSLFCKDEYPSTVVALGDTRILFFTKEDVFYFVHRSGTVALNLIRFLSGRVDFLNKKIHTLTGKDTEAKLASYLLQAQKGHDDGSAFPLGASAIARQLGCGRASLYRAIDTLVCRGCIEYNDRKIKIINKTSLERISQ